MERVIENVLARLARVQSIEQIETDETTPWHPLWVAEMKEIESALMTQLVSMPERHDETPYGREYRAAVNHLAVFVERREQKTLTLSDATLCVHATLGHMACAYVLLLAGRVGVSDGVAS